MLRYFITKLPLALSILSIFIISAYSTSICQTKSDTSIVGMWQGTLEAGGAKLRVVFHVTKDENGNLKATFDSPDQGAWGISFSSLTARGDSAHFIAVSIHGNYDGKFTPDKSAIIGVWQQSGAALNLKLERSATAIPPPKMERPQEPKPPYTYKSENVTLSSEATGMKYAGTLTLPDSGGPFPAAILITGSGVHNRNEEIFEHKPFMVIADYLTRKGIAVLRVDDRGIGGSTGNKVYATLGDHAKDVIAEIGFLKGRRDIDSNRIGLIGHSEGGMIAPMVAEKSPDIAFIVLLAGPGVPGYKIILGQTVLLDKAAGVSDSSIAITLNIEKRLLNIVMTERDSASAADKLRSILETEYHETETSANAKIGGLFSPWYKSLISSDPQAALEKVKCPVLAMDGTLDLQVPPEENLNAITDALEKGGNKDYTIKLIPGLNHLFQDAKTGSITEYAQIEETFSPEALKIVGDWIEKKTSKK